MEVFKIAYAHVTTATTTQVENNAVKKAIIMVNTSYTGTITVVDNTTGSTPVVAVITDPLVGARFEYHTLATGFRVITSATGDITAETVTSL